MTKDELIAAAVKTVDIFAGLTDRKLWLKETNSIPRTDGYAIWLDFNDQYFYQILEHELFHIYFKSEPEAKVAFITTWGRLITTVASRNGVELDQRRLGRLLDFIVNIIEDYRVNSCGKRVYPGSVSILRNVERNRMLEAMGRGVSPHQSIPTLFAFVFVGIQLDPGGQYDKIIPMLKEALDKVEGRGPDATYLVSKWLVKRILGEIIQSKGEPESAASRSRALLDLIQDGFVPDDLWDAHNDVQPPQFSTKSGSAKADELVRRMLEASLKDEDLEGALSQTEEEMEALVEKIRATFRKQMTEDQWLRREADGAIRFHDITRADAGHVAPLCAHDSSTVKRLRSLFMRVMGKRRASLEDSGAEVDLSALIEHRTTKRPMAIFKHEQSGRGFKSLILIDRSSSMSGDRTEQAERACRITNRALKFPSVSSVTWGFQSKQDGQVDITRFEPGMEVFTTTKSDVGGGTPLHLAVHVAVRALLEGTEQKQLFVITDGHPSHSTRHGKDLGTRQLMEEVRDEVEYARRHGVNVTVVLLGDDVPDKHLRLMFGSPRYWRRISTDTFGVDLVRLVSSSFLSYLRHA